MAEFQKSSDFVEWEPMKGISFNNFKTVSKDINSGLYMFLLRKITLSKHRNFLHNLD